ncbi:MULTISPECIES: Crp/Fnr family transcriptional regulator [unclassified Rhizobium]|uniref:Crp/Fnr family transcriptional regulator n=1 Tax=unclassified Rhizobium TaxID=2613769 RepID=UPI00177BBDB2|nr:MULTISPECIES: Crp/Fnr family transcriptional regulator [unclassified Rhizobium]MBD8688419.1 Crp/Fnr family transcriptional regulator [Rhizobium sp. CFBP 13644]MBD8693079.1 Crp/Fnr family transcriptional regulator [Rhizobium sp. CFBP 13717]
MTWTNNGLLKTLNREDMALIQPLLEKVTLAQEQSLFESYEPISHVYFFESGLSSEVVVASKSIEVGCIGHEGCSGVPVLLGVEASPHKAFMQVGGEALRIPSADLRALMNDSRTLREHLQKYAHVFMIQIAATALADGRYDVEQRLARWLLMCQDRLGDELPLKHDFLAIMLGVRRPSVTDALHKLEGNLAIKAERGMITVKNRDILLETAGDSYGIPEAEHRRLITQQQG